MDMCKCKCTSNQGIRFFFVMREGLTKKVKKDVNYMPCFSYNMDYWDTIGNIRDWRKGYVLAVGEDY